MAEDLVSIGSSALSARINPLGAELWSLTGADAAEYMTDADPAFWSGHAPILFPVVGSLNGDVLRHNGAEYPLPRHGFARRSLFTVIDHGAEHATFRLHDSPETRAAYPFAFVLELAYRIDGMRLDITASVTNPGAENLPFSLGYHPAFAWPLPGGAAKHDHRVTFDRDEPQDVRRVAAGTGVLLPDGEPTPVRGRDLMLDESLFAADALIWTDLDSRALRYHAPGGAALDIAFPDLPMLGLWQVPGARYICIEPWQGHADPQGFAGAFIDKPGLVILPPGAVRSFAMSITVTPR